MNSSLKDRVKEIEREEIINALRDCNWVMAKAARRLGITERMIGYKIKKYGIRREEDEKQRSGVGSQKSEI
jgi:Nif-specific regulatory protein